MLFGDANPSGKLPITYPRFANALLTYDHKWSEDQDHAFKPQFEFGFGPSYTTFEYADMTIAPRAASRNESVSVSVTVRNSGDRAGAEVVQLYMSPHAATATPPVRRLRRFAKVLLQAGEARDVRFQLTQDDFSFVDSDGRRIVEPGTFSILVGPLKDDVILR